MTVAMKIITRSLQEDFGDCHILWVYSGRRGVHCWVSDKHMREMKYDLRSAIVSYLTLIKGTGDKKKKLTLKTDAKWRHGLHPMITKSIEIVKSYFEKYANQDQGILSTEKGINRVMDMLPDEVTEIRDRVGSWKSSIGSSDGQQSSKRWKDLVVMLEDDNNERIINEIMLEFMYPRLDANVSTG